MEKKIRFTVKPLKGEDGYKAFSIRLRDDVVKCLDDISIKSGWSRNEIISTFISYGLDNYEIVPNETNDEVK